jgi:hypothetical protein
VDGVTAVGVDFLSGSQLLVCFHLLCLGSGVGGFFFGATSRLGHGVY